jgi:hypothetical protein
VRAAEEEAAAEEAAPEAVPAQAIVEESFSFNLNE